MRQACKAPAVTLNVLQPIAVPDELFKKMVLSPDHLLPALFLDSNQGVSSPLRERERERERELCTGILFIEEGNRTPVAKATHARYRERERERERAVY